MTVSNRNTRKQITTNRLTRAWLNNLGILTLLCTLYGCSSASNDDSVDQISDDPASPLSVQLQNVLNAAVEDGMPGIALSIRGSNLSFDGVAGVSDQSTMEPLSSDNRFYLASVGKTYLATAIVRLANDQVLGLDDPVTEWLSPGITDRIPSSERMTIRQLLNHTSGINDFQNDSNAWDTAFFADPGRLWSNDDALPFILDQDLVFEPGSSYRYSNSNYVLAALIAEAATGSPIATVIRNLIIEPLTLQNTIQGDEAEGISGFVHGYVELEQELIDTYPWYRAYGVSDAGMQASAADLANFIHELLTNTTLLNETQRAEMLTPSLLGNPPSNYGLGISIVSSEVSESVVYSHSGKDPGAQADFIHAVNGENRTTIALCASASFDDYDRIYQQTLQRLLEVLANAALPESTEIAIIPG